MREIKDHIVEGDSANHQLTIEVTDQPGAGGANHRYEVTGFDTDSNASKVGEAGYVSRFSRAIVLFQNGPVKEFGVNGLTQEALIAIVIDRMNSFQTGPFACKPNADALYHLTEALHHLQTRTRERLARGVEGTHIK